MKIFFQSKKITKTFLCITAALTIIFIVLKTIYFLFGHDYIFGLVPLFEFRYEGTVQTWFSVMLLLFSSALFLIITLTDKQRTSRRPLRPRMLTGIFFFLAIDEAFEVHERLSGFINSIVNDASGIFYYPWVVPYGILTITFFIFFLPFFLQLPPKIRAPSLTGLCLYVVGALGFEVLGAFYHQIFNDFDVFYVLISGVEEVIEMIGIILLNHALMVYVNEQLSKSNIGSVATNLF